MSADYSSFGLKDKIAIVTGASQGIGRAIAMGLAQAGAHVVLAKHPEGRQDEVRQVKADIEALGRKALIVLTDVSDVAQVRSMIDQAKAEPSAGSTSWSTTRDGRAIRSRSTRPRTNTIARWRRR